ncbi:hypothetical protein SCARD494_04288 [Seiridium cardinale]
MASYTIKVTNRSGSRHNYAISQQPSPNDNASKVWPCVLQHGKVPPQGVAVFKVDRPNSFCAYALTSRGSPQHGVSVSVHTQKSVQLGRKEADGTVTPGSSVQYIVQDGATDLDAHSLPPHGFVNCFEIRTGSDFTSQDAASYNFGIGFGDSEKPFAVFRPSPNMTYSFSPTDVYYLNFSDLTQGSLMDVTQTGQALKIDFTTLESRVARVTHNEEGNLILESD